MMWYLYADGNLLVASRLAPLTKRAAEDCLLGPATAEEIRAFAASDECSLVWR